MIFRSRAPLRLGLAGGGTDVSPFCDLYGGCVFNATVGMYAYSTLIPNDSGKIVFVSADRGQEVELDSLPYIKPEEPYLLAAGVYNRIVKDFNGGKALSFKLVTSCDAPSGSGLGSSSTMVVSILEVFDRFLHLGLINYEKARLAYQIEREDLSLHGGRQDQYAATFGGFNFMEFGANGEAVVNPLRISSSVINELECSLFLFYSGRSRNSAQIIDEQIKNTERKNEQTIDALKQLKQLAFDMKKALLCSDIQGFAKCLRAGWESKKKTASVITNAELEDVVSYAQEHGCEALKVSGAGGGGFLMLYCNPLNRQCLFEALKKLDAIVYPVKFTFKGVESWIMK